MPSAPLPERFGEPEDARAQVGKALEFHERVLGTRPRGMWPSEGSVCPELIPILFEAGVQWIATDEEILAHSMPLPSRAEGLYRPYRAEYEGRSVQIVFRDKELSNLLSFTYGGMDPKTAVTDFMSRLFHIRELTAGQKEPALAAVILDGENPWEAYGESGKPFLIELYTHLSRTPSIQTVKLGDHIREHPPRSVIHKLHSGSWIHHDFDIWIGSHEENMAWEYLGRTRRALAPVLADERIPASKRQIALDALYAAEGSDWFWWYGDDFASEHDEEFDRLFRAHLIQAFKVLDREVPEYLDRPIIHLHPVKHAMEPVNFITPILDGKKTSYFEWQGAGYYNPMLRAVRYHPERLLAAIYYGFNLTQVYFRVDPHERCTPEMMGRLTLQINLFTGPGPRVRSAQSADGAATGGWVEYRIIIPCGPKGPLRFQVFRSQDGIAFEPLYESDQIVLESILELAVPFEKLGWKPNERFNFTLEVQEVSASGGKVLEIYPPNGFITFTVPDDNFEQQMWSV